MDFDQAVAYLNNLQPLGIRLGLDRFRALLGALDHPERCCPAAHVAGTKGKGSVTAMMASILKQHGISAGAYLSPYVYDICERVLIDGEPASKPLFAECLDRVAAAAEGLADGPDGPCTEFEVKTALAFEAFRRSEVEASVVEVGLGGRLDATNVIEPRVCVITTIDIFPRIKQLTVVIGAGDLNEIDTIIRPVIEEWARQIACDTMLIMGRPGWQRALEGYRRTAVVLEKRL